MSGRRDMENSGQSRKVLSIVLPVYFNGDSIPEVFDELMGLERQLAERAVDLELIFVDDGSGDDSLERLLEAKRVRPNTKVISLARNFGAVAASKKGFEYVTGDAFTILAADGQDPCEQVVRMVDAWLDGSNFVISTRASRQDPLLTRIFARLYYSVLRWLVVSGYPRGGFDLMLMDKRMLPHMVGASKNTNPNLYAYSLGFEHTELRYHRRERLHGKSRWSFAKKVNFFVDTISGFSVAPIRLISGVGILIAGFSFAYGINILVNALLGNTDVRGFATLAVLISFFSGLILLMLGILGEYLWRIFDVVNNKPESVVDETYL